MCCCRARKGFEIVGKVLNASARFASLDNGSRDEEMLKPCGRKDKKEAPKLTKRSYGAQRGLEGDYFEEGAPIA